MNEKFDAFAPRFMEVLEANERIREALNLSKARLDSLFEMSVRLARISDAFADLVEGGLLNENRGHGTDDWDFDRMPALADALDACGRPIAAEKLRTYWKAYHGRSQA